MTASQPQKKVWIRPGKWIVAGVILAGVGYWLLVNDSTPTNIDFQTGEISTGPIESIVNTAGTINPRITVEVGSEISGLIRELHADFNSPVSAGQLLARIDDRDVLVTLSQRRADLEAARANLVQAQANLTSAETQLQTIRNEHSRVSNLFARQLVSEADVERTNSTLRAAEAALEQAKSGVVSAQATILQREAQLEQSQIDLERTRIVSPVDGIVLNRLVDLGQAVSASQSIPTLFEVAENLSRMQIEAAIDEASIGRVEEGMQVRFRVDAYPERAFHGEVSQVRKAATMTNNVVTYKVIIQADNPNEILLPGMTANVDIILGRKENVLRVPSAALRFRPPASVPVERTGTSAEPAQGRGDANLSQELSNSLGLDAAQTRALQAVFENQAVAMRQAAANNPGFAGPPDAGAIANMRTRMNNELRAILTEEQFARYQQMQPIGGRRAGQTGAGEPPMGRGEVWIRQPSGVLKSIPVRTGLSDTEHTEIVSDQLRPGDQVIVRAALINR